MNKEKLKPKVPFKIKNWTKLVRTDVKGIKNCTRTPFGYHGGS
jgi:hypothetical protein